MNAEEVLKELESLGSPGTKEMLMRNHGVREPCFGVKIGDMKPIRKRIKKDYQLALDLYDSGNYDAMYLAGLIADDEKMTRRDLGRWVKGAYGGSLPGTVVATVAAQGKHGWDLALRWIDSGDDNTASAGWATLSCLVALKDDADLDLPALRRLVTRAKKEVHKVSAGACYGMNSFIISVAAYVVPLTEFAKKAAAEIGTVKADLGDNSCQIPDAVGYIAKIEKRGAIGKKRKTVKC